MDDFITAQCRQAMRQLNQPESRCDMYNAYYSNGTRRPGRYTCYDEWSPVESAYARKVFRLEHNRMFGWGPNDKLEGVPGEEMNRIVDLLWKDEAGVYSSKPCGESWNWHALACFANWYWWLLPENRRKLEADIRANNYTYWAYWAMRAQDDCPDDVANDSSYQSEQAILIASRADPPQQWRRSGQSKPGLRPGAPVPQPWPVMSLAPDVDLPPLIIPGAEIWPNTSPQVIALAQQVVASYPWLRMTRTADGRGAYEKVPEQKDPTTVQEVAEGAGYVFVGGVVIVGVALLGLAYLLAADTALSKSGTSGLVGSGGRR